MRLGGPIHDKVDGPEAWARAHRALGYSAAYAPGGLGDADVPQYVAAARKHDLVIAEVGAWSNTISTDDVERTAAIDKCIGRLAYADRIGALCCVNIAGSRGPVWDGPHPDNLSADTFDLIVQVVRQIIDAVKPTRSVYALETMPWVLPDSPDAYLQLVTAIDRKGFGVHLDPVNMINSPTRAYGNADFLRECFAKLGPHIRTAHGKDIQFTQHLTIHLSECRPGTGFLDYATFVREMDKLAPDVPLMLEHLPSAAEYATAAEHARAVAKSIEVTIR